VAATGRTVVVGAPFAAADAHSFQGAAYVFGATTGGGLPGPGGLVLGGPERCG
jgi:hypothetical protein